VRFQLADIEFELAFEFDLVIEFTLTVAEKGTDFRDVISVVTPILRWR